jgi:hypothetical protein
MKTDELIDSLGRDPSPRARLAPTAAVMMAALGAIFVAMTLSIMWLRPRADLASALMAENHAFLLKLLFAVCVVVAALPIVRDLSVPGRRIGIWSILAAAPCVVIMILALRELAGLPVREWSHHVGHASWLECLWQIPALAIPAFVILVTTVRHLAPTNLMRTGAYIGFTAGGIGAVGYALHCHDDSIAFVAASYTFAILEMTLLGALLGPRMLRWRVASRRA